MAAKHLVLGLIVKRPDYGYSLKRRFKEEFGDTEFAESIIYSALNSLEQEGLIERVGEPQVAAGQRQVRTVYGSTQRGVAELDRWMLGPLSPTPMRAELRMKLALCQPRHVPGLIDAAWAQEQLCVNRLKELQAMTGSVALDECSTLAEGVEALLLDGDVAFLQTTIEWLRRTRQVLRRLAGEHGGGGAGRGYLRGV